VPLPSEAVAAAAPDDDDDDGAADPRAAAPRAPDVVVDASAAAAVLAPPPADLAAAAAPGLPQEDVAVVVAAWRAAAEEEEEQQEDEALVPQLAAADRGPADAAANAWRAIRAPAARAADDIQVFVLSLAIDRAGESFDGVRSRVLFCVRARRKWGWFSSVLSRAWCRRGRWVSSSVWSGGSACDRPVLSLEEEEKEEEERLLPFEQPPNADAHLSHTHEHRPHFDIL
jgi:hypothetical protein